MPTVPFYTITGYFDEIYHGRVKCSHGKYNATAFNFLDIELIKEKMENDYISEKFNMSPAARKHTRFHISVKEFNDDSIISEHIHPGRWAINKWNLRKKSNHDLFLEQFLTQVPEIWKQI